MRKFLTIVIFFVSFGTLYAQKYSILVTNVIFNDAPKEEKTKLTFIIRNEISSIPFFSLVSRNAQLTLNNLNNNGKKIFINRNMLIEMVSDILYKNDIDFGLVTDIVKNEKLNVTLTLIDATGPIFEESFSISHDEKAFEDAVRSALVKILSTVSFPVNEKDNPYEYDEMVFIPAGPAIIGSFNGDPIEAPQRTVYVASFYIDKYEVTNLQYKQFIDATGRKPPENVVNPDYTIWKNGTFPEELANHPVVNVTWYDAKAYCEWRGKRLPTAVEWEKAARGPYGNIYPWGNEYFEGFANLYQKGESYVNRRTVPVGTYDMSKSYYGVYDLAGNVWEWIDDTYITPDKKASKKLAKGGGWGYNGNRYTARASYSLILDPNYTSNCLGFRCAK
jgi:formylglycine-generating enzyme required for sulfatase activity